MFSLIIGIILVAFTAFACLPKSILGFGLEWGEEVILFLKGCAPVGAAFLGLIAIMLGIADIREKREAKREEAEFDEKSDK